MCSKSIVLEQEQSKTNEEKDEDFEDIIDDEEDLLIAEGRLLGFKTIEGILLNKVCSAFRSRITLIRKTIKRVYPDLEEEHKKDTELMESVISKFKKDDDDKEEAVDYDEIINILKVSNIPYVSVFIKGMFLNIFSELDTFTNNYLTHLFNLKPEVLNLNQKQFNASDVFECDSIDSFREKVIQREIDTIKRESYIDQISQLERTFGLKTLKDFNNWNKYVEITQRRNIIMHCDGIITDQYYNICKKNGHNAYIEIGDKLQIDYEYLQEAISVIEEVSIKLVQVLWRKCFNNKECVEEFDAILNDYIFGLLLDEEWNLAKELGYFAYNVIKISTEEYEMIFLINYCIALNNCNDNKMTVKLLENIDFSAKNQEFLLAKYVLTFDYDNAINLMNKIDDGGRYFKKESYPSFPLFADIRQNPDFQATYKKIFGEDINKEEIKLKIKETEEDAV